MRKVWKVLSGVHWNHGNDSKQISSIVNETLLSFCQLFVQSRSKLTRNESDDGKEDNSMAFETKTNESASMLLKYWFVYRRNDGNDEGKFRFDILITFCRTRGSQSQLHVKFAHNIEFHHRVLLRTREFDAWKIKINLWSMKWKNNYISWWIRVEPPLYYFCLQPWQLYSRRIILAAEKWVESIQNF